MDKEALLLSMAAEAEIKQPLKDVFSSWTNLEQITLQYFDFTGALIPSADSDKPLFTASLESAIDAFKNVDLKHYGTTYQMVAYIKGLLKDAHLVASVSVGYEDNDPELWDPFKESIFDYSTKHEPKVFTTPYIEANPQSVKMMILSRIVSAKDLYWIDQHMSLSELLN